MVGGSFMKRGRGADDDFERSQRLSTEYTQLNRMRPLRVAYLVVALIAFGLSVVTSDLLFISCSGFVLIAALLSAFIATRRERRLACVVKSHALR